MARNRQSLVRIVRPRFRRRKPGPAIDLARTAAVLGALLVVWAALVRPSLLLLMGAVFLAVFVAARYRRAQNYRSTIAGATAATERHAEALARRRAQLVRTDAYGKLVLGKWFEEINYFIDHHVAPACSAPQRTLLDQRRQEIVRLIDEQIGMVAQRIPVFQAFSSDMTPVDFEAFCAEQLRDAGWKVSLTPRSRDQGADVIAEKGGIRLVLQCKLYSKPVGNKAVQEAVAAKGFSQAHFCAVVSNSSYTKGAEQLAATNDVYLIHYSDLGHVEALIKGETKD